MKIAEKIFTKEVQTRGEEVEDGKKVARWVGALNLRGVRHFSWLLYPVVLLPVCRHSLKESLSFLGDHQGPVSVTV